MDVSIIIVNYRSWKSLRVCLDSISEIVAQKLTFEVIIIDNFSDDGEFEIFKNKYQNFIFIKNEANTGFSNGCNLGAKNAKGNYMLFLNADTTISLETVNTLHETYKSEIYESNSILHICHISHTKKRITQVEVSLFL